MGRGVSSKEKLISSSELKRWMRVHVVPAFDQKRKSLPPSLAFSQIHVNGTSATFLAAVHSQSMNIYAAKFAILALVRASRGRIELSDSSGMLRRGDKTIEGWVKDLVDACRIMEVDPKYLASLSNTFATLYVS